MGKRVFYVEKEKFLRSMMELALRAKGVEIHTVETLKDNTYLLEDLSPQLVIFDLDTCKEFPAELEELYAFGQKAKIIATFPKDQKPNLDQRVSGHLEKPLVALTLAERILSLVD
jgi:hypothetical protein